MAEHAQGHHRNYVKIWGILMVLLVVSIVGPMTGIRVVMLLTAFGIALVKAYIVAKNFMHLDVEKPIVHWMMAIALAFMVLLFAGVAPDVMKDKGRGWQKDAGFHPLERVGHHGEGTHEGTPTGASETPAVTNSQSPAATGPSGSGGSGHDTTHGGH